MKSTERVMKMATQLAEKFLPLQEVIPLSHSTPQPPKVRKINEITKVPDDSLSKTENNSELNKTLKSLQKTLESNNKTNIFRDYQLSTILVCSMTF